MFDNVLGGDAAFAAAVQTLTNPLATQNYLSTRAVLQPQLFLQGLLPPVRSTMSQIINGNVRIIAGAAKATAIDSPYHKVGGMQTQLTRNNTFKITSSALLNESDQDTMHEAAMSAIVTASMQGSVTGAAAAGPVYSNYIARVIEAAALSMDLGEEFYRAQVLAYGKLDLSVSNGERKIPVKATYGVDFTKAFRDRTKTRSYVAADSAFWDDVQASRDYLLLAEPVMITDPVTWQAIRSNAANAIIVTSQVQLTPTTRRLEIAKAAILSGEAPSGAFTNIDVNYRCTVIVYGLRDEETQNLYWPVGRVTFFTQTDRSVTLIDGVIVNGALGVTHQGPTTEIGNVPGRYLRGFIPENRPYHFVVDAAEDIVPELQSWRNLFFVETAYKKP